MHIPSGSELLNPVSLLERAGIREGWRVADLGCGTGYFIIPAARIIGQNGLAYGVDILKSALAATESRARLENVRNIKLVWSDLDVPGATKIKEASLDLAMLINNRVHETMIQEAIRLLKSGGNLLVIDWKTTATPFGPQAAERVSAEEAKVKAKKYGLFS